MSTLHGLRRWLPNCTVPAACKGRSGPWHRPQLAMERGFALLTWEDGVLVFAEGDKVRGPLLSRGHRSIDLVDYGEMKVRVEDWSPDYTSVQEALRRRCALDAETTLR